MSKLALDESTYFGFEHHGLSLYNKNFIEKYSRENQRKDSIELSADLKGVFEYDVDGNCTGGSVQWLTKVKKQHEIGDKKWSYDCIYNKISAGDNPSDVVYGGGGKTVLVEKNVWTYEAVTQVKTLLHKIKYKYTEEGLLSQRDEYNGDGSLFITDKYSYDEDGRIETITNIYGTIITKREYLFIDGQLFQVKINADAVEYFEFDERGNCTRSGEYLYEYKYDAKGNWTEMEAGYVTPGTAYKDHRKTVSHLIVRDIAYW